MAIDNADINKVVAAMERVYMEKMDEQVNTLVDARIQQVLDQAGGEWMRRIVDQEIQRQVQMRVSGAVQEQVRVDVRVTTL